MLACNNRCPHEGYPLREGNLDDRCILTCNWHNWKFDLQSGRNLYGGEGLRTWPVEVRGGEVWIDLADPPFAERRAGILASLREAGADNACDRMARETARLHRLGPGARGAVGGSAGAGGGEVPDIAGRRRLPAGANAAIDGRCRKHFADRGTYDAR